MFSYLRPHHKRSPSNPTSPAGESHSFERPLHPNSPLDHSHPNRYQDVDPKSSSSSLPAIARVSSADSTVEDWRMKGTESASRTQYWNGSASSQGESNTHSNHQKIPAPFSDPQRQESPTYSATTQKNSMFSKTQTGIIKDVSRGSGPQSTVAGDSSGKAIQVGRRPAGARLPTPPPSIPPQISTFEPAVPKSGKTRLNLLNPMSLLARRRTSQAVPQLQSESLISKRGSDTYDFQIKGKFVHDFSAPRTRRNVSYDSRIQVGNNSQQYERSPHVQTTDLNVPEERVVSPWSGGNHTPVFTENFDEEQYPAAGPHVRKANDISDLPLPKPPYAQSSRKPVESGPKEQPVDTSSKRGHERKLSDRKPVPDIGPEVPPKDLTEGPVEVRRISIDPGASRPKSVASTKGRPRKVSEVSLRDGIPRHMKSTSSRFSFDMIGAAEQEKLLEERHRQRALEKKNEKHEEYDDRFDGDFDDDNYDYDDMMDDDGLEERIPGVNAELDEDEYDAGIYEEEIPGVNAELDEDLEDTMVTDGQLGGFTFQQDSASPLSPYTPATVTTPRDVNGEVIGFAMTKESPYVGSTGPPPLDAFDAGTLGIEQELHGLGLQGISMPQPGAEAQLTVEATTEFPKANNLDDDDLYFDDGIIGEQDGDDGVEFDESVFDNVDTDQYGRPIRSLSSLPTLYSPPMLTADPSPSFNKIVESTVAEDQDDLVSPVNDIVVGNLAPKPSVAFHTNPLLSSQSLTQDSLAAYQSALAEAANRAAAEGKFRRASTSTFQLSPEKEHEDVQSSAAHEVSWASNQEPFSSSYDLEDDFDYDDLMEDDAIIAAANAEALANDSDGFYGQEFGFYSAPAGTSEYVNGGYFGPRGVEGINRSTSGRVASREPNLTPITERSEYSNRNSVMGFSMNRSDIVSPGLAQLAGMLREEGSEGDLSLGALMKLRRGAWGGSQASLHSSNGGSPRTPVHDENSPAAGSGNWSAGSQNKQPLHLRRNSGFSGANIVSDTSPQSARSMRNNSGMEIGPPNSEPNSQPPSPTYYRSSSALSIIGPARSPRSPKSPTWPRSPTALPSPNSISSPMSRGGSNEGHFRNKDERRSSFKKHRYTGSAESISYLKEEDPINGERWILERRRTADSGEIEVGRELVSGGRI